MTNDDQQQTFRQPDPAPFIERKRVVPAPTAPDKPAGFVGRARNRSTENGRGAVCYSTRRKGYHFYREGEGYAISDSILARLDRIDASLIFAHEADTGDVYEFPLRTYLNGDPVPERQLLDENDPQTYVPIDEARYVWRDHHSKMFRRPFSEAVKRCWPE